MTPCYAFEMPCYAFATPCYAFGVPCHAFGMPSTTTIHLSSLDGIPPSRYINPNHCAQLLIKHSVFNLYFLFTLIIVWYTCTNPIICYTSPATQHLVATGFATHPASAPRYYCRVSASLCFRLFYHCFVLVSALTTTSTLYLCLRSTYCYCCASASSDHSQEKYRLVTKN